MTARGLVDLATLEEISAQLSITGEISAAILPPIIGLNVAPPDAPPVVAKSADEMPPVPGNSPGWAGKSAPLPQFDLDDADLDLPTRTDPLPPAPPSEEEAVIPLVPRS